MTDINKMEKNKKKHILQNTPLLFTIAAIATAGTYSYNTIIFKYIRESSTSTSRDFLLRLGFYLGVLLISAPLSLLFDKHMNAGRFLNKMTGKRPLDENILTKAQQVKSGQAQFYIVFAILALGSWWTLDTLGGNFNSWYRKYGQYITALRSNSEPARIKALTRLSSYKKEWIMKKFAERLKKGTRNEMLTVIWLAGNNNMDNPEIIEEIKKHTHDKDNDIRINSILALARITDRPSIETVRMIEEELKSWLVSQKSPPLQLIFAAAFLRTSEYLNLFIDLYKINDDRVKVILTYAIVWIRGITPLQVSQIVKQLKHNMLKGSNRVKCMTTIAMAFMAENLDDETLAILRREFESKNSEFRCEPEIFSLHFNNPKKDTINITRLTIRGFSYPAHGSVRYRERLIRVLALNREESMIPWFERMAKNQNLGEYIRNLAAQAARRKNDGNQIVDW